MQARYAFRPSLVLALFVAAFFGCCSLSKGSTLTNGLLMHLSFDATNSAGVFLDDSGNGDNGTNEGASVVKGIIGAGAVSCTTAIDGSLFDYVTLGYPTNLMFDSAESFTISFWTSFTNQEGDIPWISNKNWESSGNPGWGIFTEHTDFRINVTDDSGDKQSSEDTPDITASGWHHLCVTFDRGAAELVTVYVDGAAYPSSASDSLANVTGDIDTLSDGLVINIGQDGRGIYTDDGGGEVTNLLIDDMAIWSRVLGPSEVSAIYQGGLLGSNILQVVTKNPPFPGNLTPAPGSISTAQPSIGATIIDEDTAVVTNTITLSLDGTQVPATISKTGGTTTVAYLVTNLLAPNSAHTALLSFDDNNTPANHITTNWSFTVVNYETVAASAAEPNDAVSTAATNAGFQMRVSQISDQTVAANDNNGYGFLAASVSRAEAQLAGVLLDPLLGVLQTETATPGPLANGAYPVSTVVNFCYSGSQGDIFTNYSEQAFPGVSGLDDANMAVEITSYLYLTAGYHEFGVNAADGFRLSIGTNGFDVLSPTVGLYDSRDIAEDTLFGFAVAQTGYYPVRLLYFRTGSLPDNVGSAGLQFYSVTPAGQKILVNDTLTPGFVPAYQTSSAPYPPYVSYAGPSAFVSTYKGDDWGTSNVQVIIHNGSSATVTPSSVKLTLDGSLVSATVTNNGPGLTLVSYTPSGLQLKRTVHTGQIAYSAGGTNYSETWQFDRLRNYVLTNALSYETFDELADGQFPPGWSQTNWTTPEETTPTTNFTDYNSDVFLGWTVMNTSDGQWGDWAQHLYVGLYQQLNGLFFDAVTNPLLNDQFLYCESDNRSGQQIQYVYTEKYNFTGKTGIVLAFDSAYEQNQNNIDGLDTPSMA